MVICTCKVVFFPLYIPFKHPAERELSLSEVDSIKKVLYDLMQQEITYEQRR